MARSEQLDSAVAEVASLRASPASGLLVLACGCSVSQGNVRLVCERHVGVLRALSE